MAIRLEVIAVEGVDETDELMFKVEAFDEVCASVELHQHVYNVESWSDLARAIGEAIAMLSLDGQNWRAPIEVGTLASDVSSAWVTDSGQEWPF